jgi:membrane protease YdiL (CAAX protease family)
METTIKTYYLLVIVFITYFIMSYLFKLLNINNLEKALFKRNSLIYLNLRHLIGILLFGILSYLLMPEYQNLLTTITYPNLFFLILSCIIFIATMLLAWISVNKSIKRIKIKSTVYKQNGWLYFPMRIVFLLAYEYFFRGVLLFTLINSFGMVEAISLCTVLYVLIHAFDTKSEIIGAIPFGIVLCLLSYYSKSIIIPFVLHVGLSLVYEVNLFNYLTLKIEKP